MAQIKLDFWSNKRQNENHFQLEQKRMKRKIILDTDPGVDDAFAIQFLLNADVDILAFTT